MTKKSDHNQSRVIAHNAAHELSESEIEAVAGGWYLTYCYLGDFRDYDDASGGCQIP